MGFSHYGAGIDLGTHSLKIVQGREKGGRFVLTRAIVENLRSHDPAGDEVAGIVEEIRLRPARALLGITGREVILRYTHVPPLPEYKLRNLMRFEVEEISSQTGGEVAADYSVLNLELPDQEDEIVLVGMAKKEFLTDRIHLLRKGKIRVTSACPNAIALFNAFLKFGDFKPDEVTLLMHLGAENTDIVLQKDGDLLFARNISAGGSSFTRAVAEALRLPEKKAEILKIRQGKVASQGQEKFKDVREERVARALAAPAGQIYSLAQSTLQFCQAQIRMPDTKVDRILLSGGAARLPGLAEYLAQNFGIPVSLFDPFDKVDLSGLSEGDPVGRMGPELAVALGLAQMDLDPRFFRLDILPPREAKKRKFFRETVYACLAGLLALLFLVYDYSVASHNLEVHREESGIVRRLKRERQKLLSQYEKEEAERLDLEKKYEALSARVLPGTQFARAMRLAQAHLPEELWITYMGHEERKSFSAGKGAEAQKGIVRGILLRGAGRVGKQEKTISELSDDFARTLRTFPAVDKASQMRFDRKKNRFEFFLRFQEKQRTKKK